MEAEIGNSLLEVEQIGCAAIELAGQEVLELMEFMLIVAFRLL